MTYFDHQRLTNATFKLDIDGLRRGYYADKYFENVVKVLEGARAAGYNFDGTHARKLPPGVGDIRIGDLVVEAQIFNRRYPYALIGGVDVALTMLRHCAGYFDGDRFVETWQNLDVEAIEDGQLTHYDRNPEDVAPVIKIRGRYRDFAILETPILGVLSRISRIATQVYEVLKVSNGKPVLFFPARFDLPEVQASDGYAYWLAVQRYNWEFGKQTKAQVSTDAQASWWGGRGSGTVPHGLIASFLGDTAESMEAFARYMPPDVPRIALVDFNNDTVRDSLSTVHLFWTHYREALEQGDEQGQRRWTLDGVRLDTSGNVRDRSLEPDGPKGVNPQLVRQVRSALDSAWEAWDLPEPLAEVARRYCRNVKVVVTGGFNRERIAEYERDGVPADIYGVGSSLLRNDSDTNSDFTKDVVRVCIGDQWVDMAKVGRKPNDNPDLKPADLSSL